MLLKPGTTLHNNSYRIIQTLGRGGFGVTYLAEQIMTRREVCIKEFFPKDYYKREGDSSAITLSSDGFAEAMNRFKAKFIKEAQTIAALDHPNIIHIHEAFEENGTAYYVMEYIDGESLNDTIKRSGAMAESEAVAYIKQVASALEYIHNQQIMHLDVKPGNIMVRSKDNRAILIDFGLSKHYDTASGEATSTTPVGVSHGFAPMEQYNPGGVSTFSPETDIYSLGATLYYLVTGNIPPSATDISEDGLPALPSHLSTGVREAIERSMEDKRKNRPHSIKDLLILLRNSNTSQYTKVRIAQIVDAVAKSIMARNEKTVLSPAHTPYVGNDVEMTILDAVKSPSAINGHEYVDLGLSVKWATCNVGANKPEDYGSYFAWAETQTKSSYTEENCKSLQVERMLLGLLKRYTNKEIGDIGGNRYFDAATANWGREWRLPTEMELRELRNRNLCTWTWTTLNGVNGYRVKSKKNGNSIFLPAAGSRNINIPDGPGRCGSYWSSTPDDIGTPWELFFTEDYSESAPSFRHIGCSVRPVTE